MGMNKQSEEYQLRRIRQRKVFREVWKEVFALTVDDAIIDHVLDKLDGVS